MDEYVRFVFITGVTKFEKVSIFSDLNQLEDISLDEGEDQIYTLGIPNEEVKYAFMESLMPEAEARINNALEDN